MYERKNKCFEYGNGLHNSEGSDVKSDCVSGRESVDIIEVLSMSALMRARDEDEWIRSTSGFGLILPGETEILEAAGETDRIKLREAENQTFIKMFMKYLQKNRKRVFLLAESEEKLNTVENAMKYYDKGIFLTGHALIKEGENRGRRRSQ